MYVGETFKEHHYRRARIFEYLRDNDDFLYELKQHLIQRGTFDGFLKMYGLMEIEENGKH